MRITRCGLHLRVTLQFPDHGKPLAESERATYVRMSEVMNAHVVEAGRCADAAPGVLQVGEVGTVLRPGNDIRVAIELLDAFQNFRGGASKMDDISPRSWNPAGEARTPSNPHAPT